MSNIQSKTQFVEALKDGDSVAAPFLVKTSALAVDKNGKPYMVITYQDKTGEVEGRLWDNVADYAGQVVAGAIVHIEGRVQLYNGRRQLVAKRLRLLREDEVNLEDLLTKSRLDTKALYSQLLDMVDSMSDTYYKALAEAVLRDDAEIAERLKTAPAAKSVHHAYPGGLLEHIVSVSGLLSRVAEHYAPNLNRDLLLIGGFFHDICKIWEMNFDKVTEYTTEGRLLGHLVMGIELIDRKVREMDATPGRLPGVFPREHLLLAKHVIAAHHGQLDYGSPKRPKIIEAYIVHAIDDMDSKINQIWQFMAQDQTPGSWTALHRGFDRYFMKPESLRK